MSRYDYRDPGTDPDYCDPLSLLPEDDSTPELLAHETQNVLNACKSLRSILGTTRNINTLHALWALAKWWREEMDALSVEVGDTVETHVRNLGN